MPGISSLRTDDRISTRERGARSGDYRTSHPPIYSASRAGCPRAWRLQAARRAAGTLEDPALSPSSTSSPACRSAGPRRGHRSPSVVGTPPSQTNPWRPSPLHPAPAAAAATRALRPAEPRRRRPGRVSARGGARLDGDLAGQREGQAWLPLTLTLTLTLRLTVLHPFPPRRLAASVAAEAGAGVALPLDGAERRLPGADWHERPRAAAAHAAPPHHLQRGAAAGARGALRPEPVSRRGHARTLGGPHPPAGGARGGGCSTRAWRPSPAPLFTFKDRTSRRCFTS